MNLKGIRESSNYTDRTDAPWYDPHKLMAGAMIEVARLVGSQKQAEIDKINAYNRQNPMPQMTPQEIRNNYNATVTRSPDGRGWVSHTPGKPFDEYDPDYVDSAPINDILKQAGLMPKK